MLKRFKEELLNCMPNIEKQSVLIAVSGGVDSVVLAELCFRLSLNIHIAHCNFKLRPAESDTDQVFVKQLAKRLNAPFLTKTFNTETFAQKHGLSIQLAARKLRYKWFNKLLKTQKLDLVFTAHHADDNLETILINLGRGTGIKGFTGIPKVNKSIVRPLLHFKKCDILQYAQINELDWREDTTNTSSKYLRNALRLDVIPAYKKAQPNIINGMQQTIKHAEDTSNLLDELINDALGTILESITESKIVYSIPRLKAYTNLKPLLYYIFKPYGFTAFTDIEHLLDAQAGKYTSSKTHLLQKHKQSLVLSPQTKITFSGVSLATPNSITETPFGTVKAEDVKKRGKADLNCAYIDKEMLKFPLLVRNWQQGDYFYPFGLKGTKKISKFFKDEKFTIAEKQKQLLVVSDKKIVWVVGKRLDDRFKVTTKTKQILKLSYQ